MKPFSEANSIRLDYMTYHLERAHGLARLYWRVMLMIAEWQAMG
jgi:hypothetical protein